MQSRYITDKELMKKSSQSHAIFGSSAQSGEKGSLRNPWKYVKFRAGDRGYQRESVTYTTQTAGRNYEKRCDATFLGVPVMPKLWFFGDSCPTKSHEPCHYQQTKRIHCHRPSMLRGSGPERTFSCLRFQLARHPLVRFAEYVVLTKVPGIRADLPRRPGLDR